MTKVSLRIYQENELKELKKNMSKPYETVNDYINTFPVDVQTKLKELKLYILTVVPDAVELLNYGIPAYALIKNGKREEQIMMAGYKSHIGLYPHPTTIDHFKEHLLEYKHAKGSVQFPIHQPLPKKLIMDMILYRYESILKHSKVK